MLEKSLTCSKNDVLIHEVTMHLWHQHQMHNQSGSPPDHQQTVATSHQPSKTATEKGCFRRMLVLTIHAEKTSCQNDA